MSTNRTFILVCVLAVTAIGAVGAWIAGARIVSPAEAAARTAPPTPSPILVPVESRVLSSEIVTRGTARFGLPQPISIAPSILKADRPGLITTLPTLNAQFKEGDVLLTTSGRPVFILQGDTPAYRDISPGNSGSDVRQLKEALKRLGFSPGPIDAPYDQQTSAAVSAWYTKQGFQPFGPTAEQLVQLKALEIAYGDATKVKLTAEAAAATSALAVRAARTKADYADKTARADVATRISDRALIVLDPRALQTARIAADANLELARSATQSAELDSAVAIQAALDAQTIGKFDAELAAERANQLAAELDIAKKKLGVQIALDEIVFLPSLPVRVDSVAVAIGSPASGPVMAVTDNQIVIDSSLPLDVARLVKPGTHVVIDEPAMGIKAEGTVEAVDPTPGTHGVDGYHIYFAVRVAETPTPLHGFSLRLVIPIESTKGSVTAVPVSALSLSTDGASRVQVERNGELEYVRVEPGMIADGYVEVTPVENALEPGQLVVVGANNNSTTQTKP